MLHGGVAVRCKKCGLVYATKVLSSEGLDAYWRDYETNIHTADKRKEKQREEMYQIDHDFISPFLSPNCRVLDVGCGNGKFLDTFAADGYQCEGVEFGKEAFELAADRYNVYYGELSKLNIPAKYDLIIFRGVIQYLLDPKRDLKKAVDLLNEGGIYILQLPQMPIRFALTYS